MCLHARVVLHNNTDAKHFFDSFMYGHGHIGLVSVYDAYLSQMGRRRFIHLWSRNCIVFTDTRNQDYNACSSKPVIISSQEKQIKKLCIFFWQLIAG